MRKAQQLHNSAMRFADLALAAKSADMANDAVTFFQKAMQEESQAAHLTRSQPSRAILFRSAANLAIECGQFAEAEQLSCIGLIGPPPPDVADELRHTLDRATFERHLKLENVTLSKAAIQLAISGPSVGYGDVHEPEIMSRVDAYRKLVKRSASRRQGIAFSESPTRIFDVPDFQLYISVPRAQSFAVTLRVGSRDMQQHHLGFSVSADDVVSDIMDNIVRFENEDELDLRKAIPDSDYRRNFVALTKRLAPDGQRITTVGFTRTAGEHVKVVAMRKHRGLHNQRKTPMSKPPTTILKGRLELADNRGAKKKWHNYPEQWIRELSNRGAQGRPIRHSSPAFWRVRFIGCATARGSYI